MSERDEIFIVAGEPSGDLIGSLLIDRLLRLDPELKITAVGGEQMEKAGAEIRTNVVRDLAIIGFAEVVSKFPKIRRLYNETVDYLKRHRPKVLVLIDYPGFNMKVAKAAHLLGIKVVYYVIPQVWAWHRSRIHSIRKYVDLSLVIFPFEEKLLAETGAEVAHVGHPLLDIMILTMDREEVFRRFHLDASKKLIGLLPGSRKREVDALLPVMLEAAEKIQAEMEETQFVLPRASTVSREQIDRHLAAAQVEVKVVDSYRYNVRDAMDFAIVTSGTATLETGLLLCPMVIVYKIAYPTWLIAKMLVQIPYAGLINIVAGDMVVPELLQDQCTAENVATRSLKILGDESEIEKIKYQLMRVKDKIGGSGASERAAGHILEVCARAKGEAAPAQAEERREAV